MIKKTNRFIIPRIIKRPPKGKEKVTEKIGLGRTSEKNRGGGRQASGGGENGPGSIYNLLRKITLEG